MYDDYDLDYASLSNDHYTYDLDEMCEHHMNKASLDMHNIQDSYNDDDDYARDTQDYVELAYKHYAWYGTCAILNTHNATHAIIYTHRT